MLSAAATRDHVTLACLQHQQDLVPLGHLLSCNPSIVDLIKDLAQQPCVLVVVVFLFLSFCQLLKQVHLSLDTFFLLLE